MCETYFEQVCSKMMALKNKKEKMDKCTSKAIVQSLKTSKPFDM
jgi:hypothetical protein